MSEKLESSLANGVHSQLKKLTGQWEGIATTWFEPEKFADQSPVRGSMRPILDGKFILHEYQGSFDNKPLEGLAIYGYHLGLQQFQSAWIDSFHNGTAILFSEGKRGEKSLAMLGSYAYVTPEIEQRWGWRTEIEIIHEDVIKITSYNISPEGEEARATETLYNRVK